MWFWRRVLSGEIELRKRVGKARRHSQSFYSKRVMTTSISIHSFWRGMGSGTRSCPSRVYRSVTTRRVVSKDPTHGSVAIDY